MSFYNRRNALVGYLLIKTRRRAIEKQLRRKRRSGFRVAAYVGLGLLSAGLLAAVLAIALRRRQGDAEEIVVVEDEIVGEVVTTPEPVPAT